MDSVPKVLLALAVVVTAAPARAWHDEGHHYIALTAVRSLPAELPAYFREAEGLIAHCAIDPDLHGERAIALSRDAEGPNHYIDLELLDGHELPATRHQYIKLCQELRLEPANVGYLPYCIQEWTQRLAAAFAEHRKWPENPHVRTKSLVYAGLLAHYAGDLAMPLHTSAHHDGRVSRNTDGTWQASPRSGIHARVDSLPTKLPYNVIFPEPLVLPEPGADLSGLIRGELNTAHAMVDRVYELEPKLPALPAMSIEDDAVRAFTVERVRAGASFAARLYLYTWRLSAQLFEKGVAPPYWLDRQTFDFNLDLDAVPPQPAPPPNPAP